MVQLLSAHIVRPTMCVNFDPRLRNFQKSKQKIPHEMKDVKKSDSNLGPHVQ